MELKIQLKCQIIKCLKGLEYARVNYKTDLSEIFMLSTFQITFMNKKQRYILNLNSHIKYLVHINIYSI